MCEHLEQPVSMGDTDGSQIQIHAGFLSKQ